MQGISWKDVLHYGSAVGLVMLGGLAMMGLQIPGVTIDPTICFTTAAGIFAAGLKGGATSGNGAAKVTVIKSLLFALATGAALAIALPAHAATKAKPSTAQAQANPLLVVQQFTVDDLNAAIADANAQTPPDKVAMACYQALLPIVQSGVANPLPASPGVFQALQKARDAQALIANMQSPTGPLSGVNAACAPLVLQGQNTLVQLGIMTGAVAAKVGLTLPLALPALP
jgi:hypothetical protein